MVPGLGISDIMLRFENNPNAFNPLGLFCPPSERAMKMSEQLIEDAVILACQRGESEFLGFRYLDSQVSIVNGRIDVLCFEATAGTLWIVECKPGTADAWAIDQAKSYCDEIKLEGPKAFLERFLQQSKLKDEIIPYSSDTVQAMVVAQGFNDESLARAREKGTRAVVAKFVGRDRQFSHATESEPQPADNKRSVKASICITDSDWKEYIASERLKSEFCDLCNACLQESDERRKWIVVQSKYAHLWIRYRGEAVLCMFPKNRAGIDVQLIQGDDISRENISFRIIDDGLTSIVTKDPGDQVKWNERKTTIQNRLDLIDRYLDKRAN